MQRRTRTLAAITAFMREKPMLTLWVRMRTVRMLNLSWDVAGGTYVNVKGENGINEKAQDSSNGVDNGDEKPSCSDGCNEDDNSSTGSAAEIGWQDVDDQFDENLEKRIEEFIAKVNNGWRKEKLRDK
ncbi:TRANSMEMBRANE PROTEIN [Salix purpurea]|uniref:TRANSMEMBRANE PROTEIN n=1 Tax=Salix purpurea TaxID=77065 RepID=A0A9Q0SXC2_SALPP|nr:TRANSMEMBRANE PROTEIN [Salix purpurea]